MATKVRKGKAKGKAIDQSTESTDWAWDEDGGYWCASRKNADGEIEYEYRYPSESQQAEASDGHLSNHESQEIPLSAYNEEQRPPQSFPSSFSSTTPVRSRHHNPRDCYVSEEQLDDPASSNYTTLLPQHFMTTEYGNPEEERSSTPTQQQQHQDMIYGSPFISEKSIRIHGTKGNIEPSDSSYRVRKKDYKSFFVVGKVFSTLWTEAFKGTNNDQNETFVSHIVFDDMDFSNILQFVVVKVGLRSCTCLPVTSYQGESGNRQGINLDEHGFIYSHKCPRSVAGIGISKRPLKVNLVKRTVPLQDPSLVNYVRVYTVETNIKVKEIGQLVSKSTKTLLDNFKSTFYNDEGLAYVNPVQDLKFQDSDVIGVGAGLDQYAAGGNTHSSWETALVGTVDGSFLRSHIDQPFDSPGITYPTDLDTNFDMYQRDPQRYTDGRYDQSDEFSAPHLQKHNYTAYPVPTKDHSYYDNFAEYPTHPTSGSSNTGQYEHNYDLQDAISRSLFQLWPVSYCRTRPLAIEYKVDWELPNFLKTCFVECQAIGDVLTLTGNSVDAQASSCKSFLDQTWPTISSIMLQGCQAILHSMVDGKLFGAERIYSHIDVKV